MMELEAPAPIAIADYSEPRRGGTKIAPGFNPGLKKKPSRFGAIFDGEAENRDKTQNIG